MSRLLFWCTHPVPEREPLSVPLLLFHGLCSSPQEFAFIGQDLRQRGVVHRAVVTPGYSLSHEAVSPDWRRWRDAGISAVRPYLEGDAPIIHGGLCIEAAIAVLAPSAPRHPTQHALRFPRSGVPCFARARAAHRGAAASRGNQQLFRVWRHQRGACLPPLRLKSCPRPAAALGGLIMPPHLAVHDGGLHGALV